MKKTKFMIVLQKPYNENRYVRLHTYNFKIGKEYTYLDTRLTNKMNYQRLKTELQMQVMRMMHFFERFNQPQSRKKSIRPVAP
jgi:hypothetical protein